MGVRGLWPLLAPARETTTLAGLSDRAFRSSPGTRGFRLGVDTPLWLFQAQEAVGRLDPQIVGKNAALRALFFRLCALLRKGILAVFIFDGSEGPEWKRGRMTGVAKGVQTELERAFTALLGRCGVPWRKARGEAEAELAAMAKCGMIDAVLTDDGDALVFGAPLVIRNSPSLFSGYKQPSRAPPQPPPSAVKSSFPPVDPSSRHACTLYSLQRIRTRLGFDSSALLLIALASGSDYMPEGLPGLGAKHTVSIISLAFARKLFEGLRAQAGDARARAEYARCWREAVATALERETDIVGKSQAELAQSVRKAVGFPSEVIMKAWMDPVVESAERRSAWACGWEREPDLRRIVRWCVEKLEWTEEETADHLRNLLWKGLAMRHLRLAALAIDRAVPVDLAPSASPILARVDALQMAAQKGRIDPSESLFRAVYECKKTDSTEGIVCYRVELNPKPFQRRINQYLSLPEPPFEDEEGANDYDLSLSQGSPAEVTPVASQESPPRRKKSERTRHSHWISASFLEAGGPEVRQLIDEWEKGVDARQKLREEKDARRKRRRAEEPAEEGSLAPTQEEGVFELVDSDDEGFLPDPAQSGFSPSRFLHARRRGKRRRVVDPPTFDFSHIVEAVAKSVPRTEAEEEEEVIVLGSGDEEVHQLEQDEVDEVDSSTDAEEEVQVRAPVRVASPPRRGRVAERLRQLELERTRERENEVVIQH